MQRILDIDLDFFVTPPAHWPQADARLEPEYHDVWPIDDAVRFLQTKCGMSRRLPGFMTENHGELFPLWRSAIADGTLQTPFHVTHIDAHADLGLGDCGYMHLMSSLLFRPVEERQHPPVGPEGLNDGNHLLYAIACRWLADLVYVYGEGGGDDELPFALQGYRPSVEPERHHVQLAAMSRQAIDRMLHQDEQEVSRLEPPVPYRSTRWESFQADGPFDFVCLTRSPPFTPPTADPLYDAIRDALFDPQKTRHGAPLVEKPPPAGHSRIW